MKEKHENKIKIKKYLIYYYETKRGWAIVIMPDEVRIDNFHGFPHMHYFAGDNNHKSIKTNTLTEALAIIINYLTKNDELIKEDLKEELK
ncbi:hypothetical protein [Methanobrevibacter curvatus]|uniref:Uncharacterized protein n=1 Tax=Methanobrevibacter curvatus TaxID=49547 RepID=A0A165Z1W8_9EURY|nr:hypothetical protein [Methanobrevibacter curvatus]KZX10143.1 hypothetical protein MBCUR_18780 [Methanobrevibacter curvatus]